MKKSSKVLMMAVIISFLFVAFYLGAGVQGNSNDSFSKASSIKSPVSHSYGKWKVKCDRDDSARTCILFQELVRKEDNTRVALLEFKKTNTSDAAVTLTLPFGLNVSKGVSIQINGGAESKSISYSTCYKQGCIVPMTFDKNALKLFAQGGVVIFSSDLITGEKVLFEFSLDGFSEAYNHFLSVSN